MCGGIYCCWRKISQLLAYIIRAPQFLVILSWSFLPPCSHSGSPRPSPLNTWYFMPTCFYLLGFPLVVHVGPVTFFVSHSLLPHLPCPPLLSLVSGPLIQLVSAAPDSTLCLNLAKEPFPAFSCHTSYDTLGHADFTFILHVATLLSKPFLIGPNMVLLCFLWSPFFPCNLGVGSSALAHSFPICLSLILEADSCILGRPEGWRLFPL